MQYRWQKVFAIINLRKSKKTEESIWRQAFVAGGEVFADALVTSPVAASHDSPILLVSKNGASKEVKEYVKKTIDYLIIVGGEKSIPNSVVLELEKASK